jgi:hypothetical protein
VDTADVAWFDEWESEAAIQMSQVQFFLVEHWNHIESAALFAALAAVLAKSQRILAAIERLLRTLPKVIKAVHELPEAVRKSSNLPATEQNKVADRQVVAQAVVTVIAGQGGKWTLDRYADCEVEIERSRLSASDAGALIRNVSRYLVRRPSLERVLQSTSRRLLLLQGDPGSGKSVALQHLGTSLAERVLSTNSTVRTVLPIYVDLRTFRLEDNQRPTAQSLSAFILKSINPARQPELESKLTQFFKTAASQRNCLFLFDSFDEIPEILKATEADATVASYAGAIEELMRRWKHCRGIVASRHYRGPNCLAWPVARIVPLTLPMQKRFPDYLGLDQVQRVRVLAVVSRDDRQAFSNQLMYSILCEHASHVDAVVHSAYSVFSSFIESRLHREESRIIQQGMTLERVLKFATVAAFCMTSDGALALSPEVGELCNAVGETDPTGLLKPAGEKILAMLSHLGIGKISSDDSKTRRFKFVHRRVQEFLATRCIDSGARHVPDERLLQDGSWRETAIVLIQTGSRERVRQIALCAADLLQSKVSALSRLPDNDWNWPLGAFGMLRMLHLGFANRPDYVPSALSEVAQTISMIGQDGGRPSDLIMAIEICGVGPQAFRDQLLVNALGTDVDELKQAAFQYLGGAAAISDEFEVVIRGSLMRAVHERRLTRDWEQVIAGLSRLKQARRLIESARLLRFRDGVERFHLLACSALLYTYIGGPITAYLISAAGAWYAAPVILRFWDTNVAGRPETSLSELFVVPLAIRPSKVASLMSLLRGSLSVIMAFVAVVYLSHGQSFLALITGITALTGIWVLSAPWALVEGEFIEVRRWPILFCAYIRSARRANAETPPVSETFWQLSARTKWIIGSVIVLFVVAIALVQLNILSAVAVVSFGPFVLAGLVLCVPIAILIAVGQGAWRLYQLMRERLRVKGVLKESDPLSADRLDAIVRNLRRPESFTTLLASLRAQKRLDPSRQMWSLIRLWAKVGAHPFENLDKPYWMLMSNGDVQDEIIRAERDLRGVIVPDELL